ncbi:HAMP domain-containing sensor histidine kinase [Streptomyces ureilyticus]|uniref:histidine kinase n=1 Tax=Streptomyces ureilyticus TaxID=1775131 RepID=A0ABX0DSG7_9ACTN|nr:ATP-binding protein [Streptomyces ureilyticus]NGO43404.1 GAF domain-containing protein [Streptomyces ureilyticus]
MTFGLLIALLLLVGAGALITARMADELHDEVVDQLAPVVRENHGLHDQAAHMHRSVRTYLLTGDATERSSYLRSRDEVFATLATVRRHSTDAARRNFTTQERHLRAYVRIADQQAKASPGSQGAIRLTKQAAQPFAAFEAASHRLEEQLNADIERREDRADTILNLSARGIGALMAAGGALALYAAVRTTRALTRPLQSTVSSLYRLASGDHSARAEEEGPEEIRAVARSVNALAEESDRLRTIEQERARLGKTARAVGVRIRERLDVEQVLDTVCAGIGEGLQADHAFVLLTEKDSPLVRVARAWSAGRGLLPAQEQPIPPVPLEVVREHYRRGTAWCHNDLPAALAEGPLPGAPGSFGKGGLPQDARAAAETLGLVGVLVVPVGVGDEPLGAVFLGRTGPEHPWGPVEIEIAESMAAGAGRALHTALLYKQETRLVEKLRALDKAKSDFLSTVSHELRTPLTSIVGYLELLKDEETGPLTEPQQHMLDVVDRNANRLRALIEDLLTLSRIESGAFSSKKGPVDLCRLVASAADAIRPTAGAASVTVETRLPSRPLVLEADSDQLDRVLMNLLSNAVKFTPEGGKVTVRAEARDGQAVLSVSDTGMGIPTDEQKKLFQRFFRASNATDAAIPGTGLGLTIVHTIVTNHGGEIHVNSEEGRGTTFTALLPIADANGAAP